MKFFLSQPLFSPEGADGGFDLGGGDEGGASGAQRGSQPDSYNEVRKTQRLLAKQQAENQALRQRVEDFEGRFSKHAKFFDALEGAGSDGAQGGGEPDNKPNAAENLASRARQIHQMLMTQNPDGNGIELTVQSAEIIKQLMDENKKLKGDFGSMKEKTDRLDNPMFFAEQNFAIAGASLLRESLEEVYGDASAAQDNYPDFESAASKRLGEMKTKNFPQYMKLLRDPAAQQAFVREVIQAKLPKAFNTRDGFKKLDEYSVEDAQRDMQLVQSGKIKGDEAQRLQKKARQRILPLMFGFTANR